MLTTTAPSPPLAAPASTPGTPGTPAGSLKQRVLQASVLSVGGQLCGQGLRVVSNMILTRLLFPEAFGLMAIVQMLIIGLQMISDVGIRSAIIRSDRGDDRAFLDTAWTLQVLRGLVLTTVGVALAVPLAHFYESPGLAPIAAASTLSALLVGLQSTRLLSLDRHMMLGRVVAIELASQIASIAATLTVAYLTRSVWALVVGGVTLSATRTFLSFTAVPGAGNRFRWDRSASREILHFGKWIIVSTVVTFLAMRLDVMALGKLIPLDVLGVYSIGISIAAVPHLLTARIIDAVLLPAFSASRREGPAALRRSFRLARRALLPAGLAITLAAAAGAPAFFVFLYEERYHDAAWIVQLSMATLWFQFLQQSSSRALLALGDSRGMAAANALRLAVAAAGLAVGFTAAGLPGVILGMAAGAFAGQLCVAMLLWRSHGLPSIVANLTWSAIGAGLGLAICRGPYAFATEPTHVALLTLGAGGAVVGAISLSVLRALRPSAPESAP